MKKLTLILIIFTFFKVSAQEKKIVYKQNDGKLMTESEYLDLKKGFDEKMKKAGKTGEIREIIEDSITKNSIYKKFSLSFVSTSVSSNVEHINTYVNRAFPSSELSLLNSEKIKLSDFKGKPTFITFWFTQCAPCIKELPALKDLKNRYGNKVNFLAITFNNKKEVESFLEKREFDYKHIIDAQEFINEIGLNTYPRNIFLDKNGVVQSIKNEIPYKKVMKSNKPVLEFDLSEYEKQLNNLL
mgnify:CR=1 FL=1|tara:strand:+ start:78 stop:803 length:726 start_codon:yes stop_codon:yes gene_type:complete